MKTLIALFALLLLITPFEIRSGAVQQVEPLQLPAEKHLRNVRQLTTGGENAEAYFSADGQQLIFQSKREGRECDQIYTMRANDGSNARMVSTGAGRTTCSYFFRGRSASFIRQRISAERRARRNLTIRAATSGPSILHTTSSRHGSTAQT